MSQEIQMMRDFDKKPNVPYFTHAISNEIRKTIEKMEGIFLIEDEFAIYAYYSNGQSKTSVIIDAHLDHPAFAINTLGVAQAIGSIATSELIPQINLNQVAVPVIIFTENGMHAGNGHLESFKPSKHGTIAYLSTNEELSKNMQVIPELYFSEKNGEINMRSADNLSNVAIAVEILSWLSSEKPTANVTVVFTKNEEIAQVSATHIALSKRTPFSLVDQNTQIIVLEAASVGKTSDSQKIKQMEGKYQSGILIRISDNELVYQVDAKDNLAEASALYSIQKLGIKNYQHGPSIGRCNATAYTLFSGCPNIVGITIPCLNKHNFNADGYLSNETIKTEDVHSVTEVLKEMIRQSRHAVTIHTDQIVKREARFPGNNDSNIRQRRKLLTSAYLWAKPRLIAGHLYSNGKIEESKFIKGSVISFIQRQKP